MRSLKAAPRLRSPRKPDGGPAVGDRFSRPARSLNIVFLVNNLAYGGAERQVVVLARALHERGHTVSVLTLHAGGGLEPELRAGGVRLRSLEKRGRWDIAGFFIRLAQALREERPDILHGYLSTPNIATTLIRPVVPGLKTVWGERASNMELSRYHWIARFSNVLEIALSRFPDLHIVNSWAGLADATGRGYPAAKCAVIPNGIDTDRFRPDPVAGRELRTAWGIGDGTMLVGRVGRLDAMKDHSTFLTAAAQLARQRDDVQFVCLGNGDVRYRAELEQMGREAGLDGRLRWFPAQAKMNPVYNALDVACSSSAYGEGFPNVVGEAMACGVPCVVTDVGDSARLVGDGRFVVPPRDPEKLAGGLDRVLSLPPTERDHLRVQLRQRVVDHFSVARLTEATEQTLLALCDGT
jgi:glycosyltransferase involved in cell wall biosynthesis